VATYYDVQAGDTLGSIAATYGTSVDELLSLNPGIDPATLRVGQRIRVG
jgi:LysM repeat protein